MTAQERAYRARLERRAGTLAPDLAQAQLRAYDMIRRALTERETAEAIRSGRMDELMSQILSDRAGGPFARLKSRLDAGILDATEREIAAMPTRFRTEFDRIAPWVLESVRVADSRMMDTLSDQTRETVRVVVQQGMAAGKNPRVIARELPAHIGLAPNQVKAIENFRRELETGDRAALQRMLGRGVLRTEEGDIIRRGAHAGGEGLSGRDLGILDRQLGEEPLSPEQIDRMVKHYGQRLERWNVESNARTMALDANKRASDLAWEDAVEKGVVERTALRKTWTTAGDERVRPEHRAMQGETVGFDESYSNGQKIPGETDWNCRCLSRISVAT